MAEPAPHDATLQSSDAESSRTSLESVALENDPNDFTPMRKIHSVRLQSVEMKSRFGDARRQVRRLETKDAANPERTHWRAARRWLIQTVWR